MQVEAVQPTKGGMIPHSCFRERKYICLPFRFATKIVRKSLSFLILLDHLLSRFIIDEEAVEIAGCCRLRDEAAVKYQEATHSTFSKRITPM